MTDITIMVKDLAATYLPNALLAIVTLFVGLKIIKKLAGYLEKTLQKRGVDQSLTPFITSLFAWTLKVLLFVSVAGIVGIETTSFVAVLGAAGLAVGLALKGSLSNFAGGVMILIFRPFKVGDYIEAQGLEGKVEKVDLFATTLVTVDNKKLVIPNGPLSEGTIKNFTAKDLRRVDLAIGIGYNDDVRTALSVLREMCEAHPKALKEPDAPFVGVTEYADSSINLAIRVWTNTSDYWAVFFDLQEQLKYTLDQNKISIPYPQREVTVIKEN